MDHELPRRQAARGRCRQLDEELTMSEKTLPRIPIFALGLEPLAANRSWLGDIKQAGGRQILIDQYGRTLYYGIHANQAFADFVKANGLDTPDGVRNADPTLFFPGGMVIFKSAWQEVDPNDPT